MDILLEIGVEEMPAGAVYSGISQIESVLPGLLEGARLAAGTIRVLGTPRRLAAMVTGIPDVASPEVSRKKGPPLAAAKDEGGSWTKAAVGFARSQGVDVEDLSVEDTSRGSYVFAVSRVEGEPALQVLPGLLAELVGSLKFKKSMRWGNGEVRFSRPVRWLLAIAGGEVIPFRLGELESSNVTYGHRYLGSGDLIIDVPGSYEGLLEREKVVADQDRRRAMILESTREVCAREGMVPVVDDGVLEEVVQLVEWPGVLLGRFDRRFLELPREVLVHAMQDHQRYFPMEDAKGELQAGFLAVQNGDTGCSELIGRGHERVLAARLSDAEFFFNEDLKRPLAERTPDLEHVVYQSELGSMAEKSARLGVLVGGIGDSLGMDGSTVGMAKRAAALSKCDLVTHMVVEFPALQGVMGSIYATRSGEDVSVAEAIREQYLPRRAGDAVPGSVQGAVLSLAEKSDNLAASFGLGHVPTGSLDPYGLRRQALGMIIIMIERGLPLSVSEMVRLSASELEAEAHGFSWTDEAESALAEFFSGRERVFFTEAGYRYDLVEAVMAVDWDRPLSVKRRLESLALAREEGLLERLYTAFERCHNLSRGKETGEVSEGLFTEEIEGEVFALAREAEVRLIEACSRLDFQAAIAALEPVCGPVDTLFDDVLIMDEDPGVRVNRLSLLAGVDALFNRVADFSLLTWD
ncbi:MAG: glycine--tRNA ligase subunit beta [Actinobacteria bacterium]|nr:glycine--tRNA ligase subunit beta [Actinomycetota bacterium]MCG2817897.1 glycine--tRNA ligase subunit beta [Actinomycetes bacterium]MBU4219766.1 glycine--tRNA ligase subunit beta [Actinomycetota bacterium]MBU4357826.1 glycine--tRNA ligase subunit beta [Actinomycetota bacterium]MBU4392653.1 glycine--tRNA ligase subunit beta [Actinomycetota bacterium]